MGLHRKIQNPAVISDKRVQDSPRPSKHKSIERVGIRAHKPPLRPVSRRCFFGRGAVLFNGRGMDCGSETAIAGHSGACMHTFPNYRTEREPMRDSFTR